jgi:hypothetical protein
VLELLTGAGLAASAGLNAWIPLLAVGLLARYTDLLTLPAGWDWLTNGWTLTILAVLLAAELVADKIPILDSLNDLLQTAVRPAAGGIAFGAGATAETVTVSDPGEFFTGNPWVPVVAGVLIALAVHLAKTAARPVVNAMTGGTGGPVVSLAEDTASITVSVAAILAPVLVLGLFASLVVMIWWALRRRARRRGPPPARAA